MCILVVNPRSGGGHLPENVSTSPEETDGIIYLNAVEFSFWHLAGMNHKEIVRSLCKIKYPGLKPSSLLEQLLTFEYAS